MSILKSDIITDADDLDIVAERGHEGVRRTSIAHCAAAILADNDVILGVEVSVDALLPSVLFAADDLGTTGDLNLGFYPGRGSGVTIAAATDAVDEDALAVAVDVNAAATALTELRFSAKGIETAGQKVWELAGLSARPDYHTMFIALTASEASTAAGDVVLIVDHIQ